MRNFLVFCLALAVVLLGQITHFLIPTGLSATEDFGMKKFANLISVESTDSNAVEVDGIRFEILVPERVWIIPKNQPNSKTDIEANLRITNQNQEPVRFHYATPVLTVTKPDGEELSVSGGAEGPPYSQQFICRTLLPNESLNFSPKAKLYWHNDQLDLEGLDGVNGIRVYQGLQPGSYRIRFLFIGLISRAFCPDPKNPDSVERNFLEGFWTGQAATPFVEVQLVEN